MSDYNSRQAAIDAVEGLTQIYVGNLPPMVYRDDAIKAVMEMPTADVAPVRHGRWKRVGDTAWECSACGCISCCNGTYCPDCGASMMEGAEDAGREH